MADSILGKIKYVDQFNADVVLAAEGAAFIVQKVVLISAAAGDILRFEDSAGNRILHITNNGGNARHTEIDFGPNGYNFGNRGVVIDVSDCTGLAATDGTDALFVYTL